MKCGALVLFMVFLAGCAGDHRNTQSVQHGSTAPILPMPPILPSPSVAPADTIASENAVQNSLTGLGVQVAKVAEKIQGFGGDLAHLQATANAEIRADLAAQIRAEMSVHLQAQAEANAQILSAINAQVQAQAGLRNSIDQTAQTVNAARDANVQTIQFTKEMQSVLEQSYKSAGYLVYVFCGALVSVVYILQERSRARADRRHKELFDVLVPWAKHQGEKKP